jgi:homospermidine synthase
MTDKLPFPGRLVVLGCGAVARCLLLLLLRHLDLDGARLTVIDAADRRHTIPEVLAVGATYLQQTITPANLAATLAGCQLGPGDALIDLALDIETIDELAWCHRRGVWFLNASIERWAAPGESPGAARPLYDSLQDLRRRTAGWAGTGRTAVADHGANPGLVSHFTKVALTDLAGALLTQPERLRIPLAAGARRRLEAALAAGDWAGLARAAGVRVVHISEEDTQQTPADRAPGEFANTWSPPGLWWEAAARCEFAWGSHERALPAGAHLPGGPTGSGIRLATRGMHTLVRSWVPRSGPISGMVLCHEECFTIADLLTSRDGAAVAYRPTVLFAYRPAAAARASLAECAGDGYALQARQRVLGDDINAGMDELGVLLVGDHLTWWTGSQLDIHETRRLLGVTGHNATTLQVAAPMLGALAWILRHPTQGVCLPEDLDHEQVLQVASPYLGPCPSIPTGWTPTDDPTALQFGAFCADAGDRPRRASVG